MQPFVPDSGRSGDMSERAWTGSEATKWWWCVEASGPYLFALILCQGGQSCSTCTHRSSTMASSLCSPDGAVDSNVFVHLCPICLMWWELDGYSMLKRYRQAGKGWRFAREGPWCMLLANEHVVQGGPSQIAVTVIDYRAGSLPVGWVGGGETPPPCCNVMYSSSSHSSSLVILSSLSASRLSLYSHLLFLFRQCLCPVAFSASHEPKIWRSSLTSEKCFWWICVTIAAVCPKTRLVWNPKSWLPAGFRNSRFSLTWNVNHGEITGRFIFIRL